MQDELRYRLELTGMAIGSLPDALETQLINAGKQLSETLLAENKVIAIGLGDGYKIAEYFVDELINSSQLDRPPLPCVLVSGNTSPEKLSREVSVLTETGDLLVLFQSSQQNRSGGKDEKLTLLYETINTLKARAILVGHSYTYHLEDAGFISLTLDNVSRMNYLCSGTVIGMTLAALIDHQLFGHPI